MLKGSWPRGPLDRKAAFLFSVGRGSKFFGISKTQDSPSLRCIDHFQRPWLTVDWLLPDEVRDGKEQEAAFGGL